MAANGPAGGPSVTLQGEDLRTWIAHGIEAVRGLVASTYGPDAMDKLVTLTGRGGETELVVTNSGHEVLDTIERADGFTHPVAAIVADAVDTQHRTLGDGSTGAVLLTAALVDRGHDLVERGVAPRRVVVGFAMAANRAGEVLDGLARPVTLDDRERLREVARTTMGHRLGPSVRDRYASLAVEAVRRIGDDGGDLLDTDRVKVVTAADATTALHHGVVVTRWPRGLDRAERSAREFDWSSAIPRPLVDARVAVLDGEMDVESTATSFGVDGRTGVWIEDAAALSAYRDGYERAIAAVVDHVAARGVDVLVSGPRVDEAVRTAFGARDVVVVDQVETPEADIDRLARATGAAVVSRPEDLTADRIGTAGRVVEYRTADEKWTAFTRCSGPVVTLELRTPTDRSRHQHRRVVEAAAEAVAIAAMDRQVVPGAGAAPLAVAAALRDHADGIDGKEQLAVRAFADALDDVVRTLAANAGLDPIDTVTRLRAAHAEAPGGGTAGIDLATGAAVDAWTAGVVEPRRTLSQSMETARTLAGTFVTTDAMWFPNVDLRDYRPRTEHD